MLGREWLQDDVIVVLVNNRARSLIDFKVFAQPTRDHDLPFDRE